VSGNLDVAAVARETASAEARALTSALEEAFAATLRAPDLPPEEIREGLRDVLATFAGEWERRIPAWTGASAPNSTPNTGEGIN
jgi:hypothetical protein